MYGLNIHNIKDKDYIEGGKRERLYIAPVTTPSCQPLWGQHVGWEGWKPVRPVATQRVKHGATLLQSRGTYFPEALNIPPSWEVQRNLKMLGISERQVLAIPGWGVFVHTLDCSWPMLTPGAGEGYQRAAFSLSELLLQWDMERFS